MRELKLLNQLPETRAGRIQGIRDDVSSELQENALTSAARFETNESGIKNLNDEMEQMRNKVGILESQLANMISVLHFVFTGLL